MKRARAQMHRLQRLPAVRGNRLMRWHLLWRVCVCSCAQISRSGSRGRLAIQRSGFLLRVHSVTILCTCVYTSVYYISIRLPPLLDRRALCTFVLLSTVQKVTEMTAYSVTYKYAKNMVSFTCHTQFCSDTHAHAHICTRVHMYIQCTPRAHRQDNNCWIQ